MLDKKRKYFHINENTKKWEVNIPDGETSIDLTEQNLELEQFQALVDFLKENQNITKLKLSGTPISLGAGALIADLLKTNTGLKSITLAKTGIRTATATAIAESLKTNTNLEDLDLSFNSFSIEGLKALAETLEQNTTLKALHLNALINVEDHAIIGNMLKVNKSLKALNYGFNYINSDFLNGLKQNKTLSYVNLKDSGLSVEKQSLFASIAEFIKNNNSLVYINYIQPTLQKNIDALEEAWKNNFTLLFAPTFSDVMEKRLCRNQAKFKNNYKLMLESSSLNLDSGFSFPQQINSINLISSFKKGLENNFDEDFVHHGYSLLLKITNLEEVTKRTANYSPKYFIYNQSADTWKLNVPADETSLLFNKQNLNLKQVIAIVNFFNTNNNISSFHFIGNKFCSTGLNLLTINYVFNLN